MSVLTAVPWADVFGLIFTLVRYFLNISDDERKKRKKTLEDFRERIKKVDAMDSSTITNLHDDIHGL